MTLPEATDNLDSLRAALAMVLAAERDDLGTIVALWRAARTTRERELLILQLASVPTHLMRAVAKRPGTPIEMTLEILLTQLASKEAL